MNWWQNERMRWAATAAVIGLVIVVIVVWTRQAQPPSDATLLLARADQGDAVQTPPGSAASSPVAAPAPSAAVDIAVDVIGAVQQPGVYYLPVTARVDDAVTAAGGLAPDADRDQINLAAHVTDGEQIRVPRVGDAAAPSVDEPVDRSRSASGPIDLNSADAATLDDLPGVGPATADAIIEYRAANGPFKRVEDIDNVKGIGPGLLAELAPLLTVSRN